MEAVVEVPVTVTEVVVTVVVDTVVVRAHRSPTTTALTGQQVSLPHCSDRLTFSLVQFPSPMS